MVSLDSAIARFSIAKGSIRWGYHHIGDLRQCEIRRDRKTKRETLTAAVVHLDLFKARQRPLYFVVLLANGRSLEWPIEAIEASADAVVATLGPRTAGG